MYRYIPSDATPRPGLPVRRARHGVRPAGATWVERTRRAARRQGRGHRARPSCRLSISTSSVKPLDDIRVRQAIAHAIDRKGMVAVQGRAASRAPRCPSCRPATSAPTKRRRSIPTISRRPRSCWRRPAIRTASRSRRSTTHAARHADRHRGGAGPAARKPASISTSSWSSTRRTTPDPQGPVADRALSGGALSGGRHLPEAVLHSKSQRQARRRR